VAQNGEAAAATISQVHHPHAAGLAGSSYQPLNDGVGGVGLGWDWGWINASSKQRLYLQALNT